MTDSTVPCGVQDEMSCPTCHARQPWSDECRRCKCDLSLLRQLWRASEAGRRRCLCQLRAGRADRALRHARRYATIAGAPQAARLLAVCHALCNDWCNALAVAGGKTQQKDAS